VLARTGLVVALLMAGGVTLAQAKDVALIANKGSAVTAVTMPDLVKLCKAQTPHWPDGKSVTLVVRDPSSSDMRMILEKVYAMAPQAVNELFATANHGKGAHPMIVVVTSDDDLVHKVAATQGAIGLVDVYAINSSVDVMKVAGKLPFEPGYPLHGN
jgi:ABC-type phosphate transport system substrate-binding protein